VWIDEVIQTSPGIDTSGYQIQVGEGGFQCSCLGKEISVLETIGSCVVRMNNRVCEIRDKVEWKFIDDHIILPMSKSLSSTPDKRQFKLSRCEEPYKVFSILEVSSIAHSRISIEIERVACPAGRRMPF